MFNDKNETFLRFSLAIIPLIATFFSWFLAIIGNAKDYKDASGKI